MSQMLYDQYPVLYPSDQSIFGTSRTSSDQYPALYPSDQFILVLLQTSSDQFRLWEKIRKLCLTQWFRRRHKNPSESSTRGAASRQSISIHTQALPSNHTDDTPALRGPDTPPIPASDPQPNAYNHEDEAIPDEVIFLNHKIDTPAFPSRDTPPIPASNSQPEAYNYEDEDSISPEFASVTYRALSFFSFLRNIRLQRRVHVTSFDQYFEESCPRYSDELENFVKFARILSIRDIADWVAAPPLVPPCHFWGDSRQAGVPTELGPLPAIKSVLRSPAVPSPQPRRDPAPEPIQLLQESLHWSKQPWDGHFNNRRTALWRLVVAQSTNLDPSAFTLPIPDGFPSYTLTPKCPSRWYIPLQQIHTTPFAIPPELADEPHSELSPEDIAMKLNAILSAHRTLESDLESWIRRGLEQKWDLGMFYGHSRPWWRLVDDFATITTRMELKKRTWDTRYKDQHADLVAAPGRFPPRRVWDLYSNRILPSHVIFTDKDRGVIPRQVWAVSHAWLAEDQRHSVLTSINGHEWPVPIPRDTTLDHIRIELLNMGAEYVFLDVLCLRQLGDPKHEQLRQKEWEFDIPTLQNVYRRSRDQSTVVYFSGLGLPLDIGRDKLNSKFHWFQRAWTLQETTQNWLPGGLTDPISGGGGRSSESTSTEPLIASHPSCFDLMNKSITTTKLDNLSLMDLVYAFQDRPGVADKKDHDRVAALTYLVPCVFRLRYAVYNDADATWSAFHSQLLILPYMKAHLLEILLRCPVVGDDHWIPSWRKLMAKTKRVPSLEGPGISVPGLELKSLCWMTTRFVWHSAYVPDNRYGLCYNHIRGDGDDITVIDIPSQITLRSLAAPLFDETTFHIEVYGDLPPDEEFTLIRFNLADQDRWIIGENMGERIIDEISPDEPTLIFKKLAVGYLRENLSYSMGLQFPRFKQELKLDKLPFGRTRPVVYWTAKTETWLDGSDLAKSTK